MNDWILIGERVTNYVGNKFFFLVYRRLKKKKKRRSFGQSTRLSQWTNCDSNLLTRISRSVNELKTKGIFLNFSPLFILTINEASNWKRVIWLYKDFSSFSTSADCAYRPLLTPSFGKCLRREAFCSFVVCLPVGLSSSTTFVSFLLYEYRDESLFVVSNSCNLLSISKAQCFNEAFVCRVDSCHFSSRPNVDSLFRREGPVVVVIVKWREIARGGRRST